MNWPEFSPRECPLCRQLCAAHELGHHLIHRHTSAELARYPGGFPAILSYLEATVVKSLIEAEGHPEAKAYLQNSLARLRAIQAQLRQD